MTKNIPNARQWKSWNTSRQALWVVEEAKAHWRITQDDYHNVPNVEYAETQGPFSSQESGSFRELVANVAGLRRSLARTCLMS